ncbi:GNAT family N-acetyltransferase [Streptomyces sp. NPDC091292]|uniref:GNAT family N-acetyltransferase n=1 Tax=Streptomyces sp. NPDC091292 TaxID=3365991 RepID=UPI0038131381
MDFEVRRDSWGIPHLRAADARALAYAQGHNAAVDRAWQIEVERHRALGTTAAFLGVDAVGWDTFARQARLDDTARRCFRRLADEDPETAAWLTAYAEGVEAGLARGAAVAPEFAATGLAPGGWRPWTPLGVWLSTHILFAGFPAKLWRDATARRLGPGAVDLFAADGTGTSGSNGWLVAGGRTGTGHAVIAGDPHRFIEDPGVYQQIHLVCPEFDVIGLAVPGVPGLAHFGHTGTVAWAITNAMADYQDLYRERLRRVGGGVEAFGPDGWEAVAVHTETIEVAGAEPVRIEVVETERGPVVIDSYDGDGDGDGDGRDVLGEGVWAAVSLRYPPRVTHDLGFSALPALLRARTVADVDRALDGWAEPVNVVQAADTDGGLLHRVAGRVPVRHADNGRRTVPAWDPAYAWHGRHGPMPRAEVGDRGTAVMANQRGLAAPFGVEFAPPYRADRIQELLDADHTWTAKDMAAIHMDTRLPSARPLLDLLAGLDGLSDRAARLRERLLGWDRRMAAGSREAMAYAEVRGAVVRRFADHPELAPVAQLPDVPQVFRPWLALAPRVAFALETLLTTDRFPGVDRPALVRAAVEEVAAGAPGAVPWGEAHRLTPWRALPDPDPDPDAEPGPALAGDHDCVLCTSSLPAVTDRCARGPAARYVWDLARRDDSLWVVPLGASGAPGPHQRDQLPLWLRGELVPVITDWNLLLPEPPAVAARPVVHAQVVDGFGTVRIRPVDPDADHALLHAWLSPERARFWGMTGQSREQVRRTYAHLDSLDTHHAFLMFRDEESAALFQTYEPTADRVSECYQVEPGDTGIHLLIGPGPAEGARGHTATLVDVFLTYVLADPAVRRVVAEPDAANTKALTRLARSGFTLGPEVVLPEVDLPEVHIPAKRARLAFFSAPPPRPRTP